MIGNPGSNSYQKNYLIIIIGRIIVRRKDDLREVESFFYAVFRQENLQLDL